MIFPSEHIGEIWQPIQQSIVSNMILADMEFNIRLVDVKERPKSSNCGKASMIASICYNSESAQLTLTEIAISVC